MHELYEQLKTIIETETDLSGTVYTSGKFTGIGWFPFNYKTTTYEQELYLISLKEYEKTVNLYVMHWVDGENIVGQYVDVFGKSAVGKGCIRIKKLSPEREHVVRLLVQQIATDYNKQK